MAELDHRRYWDAALPWRDYLEREVREHRGLWTGVWERARVPGWARDEAAALGPGWRLLVISEDWCGDAANTVPVVAALGEAAGWEVRVLKRDEHPELMDAYLTGGTRSIPMTLALRGDFTVAGHWGPRPAELQRFALAEKRAGLRPAREIYRDIRQWYARDRGESTLRELLTAVRGDLPRAEAA